MQVTQVIPPVAGAAGGPVDEGHRQSLPEDGVERARVAVQHAIPAGGQPVPGGGLVQQAEHRAAACICTVRALAGVIGGLAGDVTQDVPAAVIEAQVARRIGVTSGFQVYQHPGGEPAASIPGTMDGVTDPGDLPGVVAAAQRLLSHSTMISQIPRRSTPTN
jgi:hypothetical protein